MTRLLLTPASFCLALLLITVEPLSVIAQEALRTPTAKSSSAVGLKDAAKGLFGMGIAAKLDLLKGAEEMKLVERNFEFIAPENCLKPKAVMPKPNTMKFDRADAFFDFAQHHEFKIVGHCLLWARDGQTPRGFYVVKNDDGTERKATRDELLKRMQQYITAVVERYGDRVDAWDVVNEVNESGTTVYRPSGWLEAFGGPEFVAEAFKAAHAADPTATLILNDYQCEFNRKRPNLLKLIKYLQEKEAPIHAIGIQGHYDLDNVPIDGLETTFNEIRKLGLKVIITELDIDVVKRAKWYQENGKFRDELKSYDPYKDGLPPEVAREQAEQYGKLFQLFVKHSDVIERVTLWGLHDGVSWLNTFPWDRVNHPMLFDRQLAPKLAYDAVMEALLEGQRELKDK